MIQTKHGKEMSTQHTDTSVSDTSVSDTSVSDTSVSDTSANDTSANDTSVSDTSANDTSVSGVSDNNTTNFISHVNAIEKRFGHNKLQLEVERLSKEVERWKLADSEKEMKLVLLKKTISTLQSQNTQHIEKIAELEQVLKDAHVSIGLTDLQQKVTSLQNKASKQHETIITLQSEKASCEKHVTELNATVTSHLHEKARLEDELNQVKAAFHSQTSLMNTLQEHERQLMVENEASSSLLQAVKEELSVLKQELVNHKSKAIELQDNLCQKEECISKISLQLNETESTLEKHIEMQTNDSVVPPLSTRVKVNGKTRRGGRRV